MRASLSPADCLLHLCGALARTPRKAESAIRVARRRNNWVYLTVSRADCSTGFTHQDTTALGASAPAMGIAPPSSFSDMSLAGTPATATAQGDHSYIGINPAHSVDRS